MSAGATAAHLQAQGAFEPGPSPDVEGVDEPAVPATSARTATEAAPAEARALAKPPVRKLAKDLGVDITTLTPTGPQRHGHPGGRRGRGCRRRRRRTDRRL